MSNYVMQVDFCGNLVRCETDGLLVSLNDLVSAGNDWRRKAGQPYRPLDAITRNQGYADFVAAVAEELNCPVADLTKTVKGRNGRTMAHLFVAIYVAEQLSPRFHVYVIKTFIEGKLLEFRELGGTEFKTLNAAIDLYLPGRENKPDNRGVYIQCAKLLRAKILGEEVGAEAWGAATAMQTHMRYDVEKRLVDYLNLGMVRDYDHLKELIRRM